MLQQTLRRLIPGAVLAGSAWLSPAHAATLDFESVAPTLVFSGASVAQGGFTFTANGDFGSVDSEAGCFIAQCPSGSHGRFYSSFNDTSVTLTASAGGFALQGFEAGFLAPIGGLGANLLPGRIQLYATYADNSTALFSWDFAPSAADSSFPFASFTTSASLQTAGALKSVQFSACVYEGAQCLGRDENLAQFAIDNVRVTAVPEPASAALMALGAVALLWRGRRAGRVA